MRIDAVPLCARELTGDWTWTLAGMIWKIVPSLVHSIVEFAGSLNGSGLPMSLTPVPLKVSVFAGVSASGVALDFGFAGAGVFAGLGAFAFVAVVSVAAVAPVAGALLVAAVVLVLVIVIERSLHRVVF